MLASKLFDNEELNSCYIGVLETITIMFQTISLQCYACYAQFFFTFSYSDLREQVLAMWSQCVLILFQSYCSLVLPIVENLMKPRCSLTPSNYGSHRKHPVYLIHFL